MITSPHNPTLKTIRRLRRRRDRERTGLVVAEGEDLVAAARAAGLAEEAVLEAGVDVEAELLAEASSLGHPPRVIGLFHRRWSRPGGDLSVYLHAVRDPGNVGTIVRSAHALCDGPVVLGPGCADPWSAKALRASMGSAFARPPARASVDELAGTLVALAADAPLELAAVTAVPPIVVALGGEREGLPDDLLARADAVARIPTRAGGPESLNVAMAATVALYELGRRPRADNRMAGDG